MRGDLGLFYTRLYIRSIAIPQALVNKWVQPYSLYIRVTYIRAKGQIRYARCKTNKNN